MGPVFLKLRLFLHLDYFTLHWIRMLLQGPLSWLQYQVGRSYCVRRRGVVILRMPSIWCNSKSLWNHHFDKSLPLHQLLSALLKVSPRLICQVSWHTNCAIASNVAFWPNKHLDLQHRVGQVGQVGQVGELIASPWLFSFLFFFFSIFFFGLRYLTLVRHSGKNSKG